MSNRWLEITFLVIVVIGLVALVALVVAGIRVVFRPTTPAVEPAQPHVVVSTPQPERR